MNDKQKNRTNNYRSSKQDVKQVETTLKRPNKTVYKRRHSGNQIYFFLKPVLPPGVGCMTGAAPASGGCSRTAGSWS